MTAAEKILKKALVASNLDSRKWNSIQAGLRDRAFFSSRVAEANILDALQNRTAIYSDGHTSMSAIRQIMRQDLRTMGYKPKAGEEGTIKDLYSKARLDVIVKHNVATARGFIRWAEGNEPGAYAAFPAQEFKRVHPRKHERGATFWTNKWKNAGGRFFAGGRMIALKDDPVWTNLSIFGTPYPPFEWGSGMGVRDIDRKTAIELGLATDAGIRERVQKLEARRDRGDLPSMNGNLKATVPATRECVSRLKSEFGDLADIVNVDDNLTIKWRPEILRETVLQKKDFSVKCGVAQQGLVDRLRANQKMAHFADAIEGQQLVIDNTWRDQKRNKGGTHLRHFYPMPKEPNDVPLRPEDIEMVPCIWRDPDRLVKNKQDELQLETDAFDGSTYCLRLKVIDDSNRKHVKVWTFFRTFDPLSKKNGLPKNQIPSKALHTP